MNISITELERLAKDSMLTMHKVKGRPLNEGEYYTHFIIMNDIYVVPVFYSKYPYMISEVTRYFQKVCQRYGLVVVERGAGVERADNRYRDNNFVVARVRIGRKNYWFNYYGHVNGEVVIPNMPVCGVSEGIVPYRDIAEMHGINIDSDIGSGKTAEFFRNLSWEDYKREYTKCYGAWKPITLVGSSKVQIVLK